MFSKVAGSHQIFRYTIWEIFKYFIVQKIQIQKTFTDFLSIFPHFIIF